MKIAVAETDTVRAATDKFALAPGVRARGRAVPVTWGLAAILAVAAGLRFFRLDGQSLWLDEVLSVARARTLLVDGLDSQLFNGHGPLFFYLTSALLPLQPDELLLRLPSVFFGIALVAVMYALGKEFNGPRGGLAAAALTAVSPYAIWYSQEARYISLFMLLAALSLLFMRRFERHDGNRNLALYVVCAILMLLSFVGGVFLVAAQNLWMGLARVPPRTLRRWVVGQALVALVFVPWLVHAYQIDYLAPFSDSGDEEVSISEFHAGFSRFTDPIQIGYVFLVYGVGFSFGPSTQELHREPNLETVRAKALEVVSAVVLIGTVGFAGLLRSAQRSKRDTVGLALCMLLPVLGAFAVASTTQIAFNVRYTSAAFPAYLLFFSAGLLWWTEKSRAGSVVIAGILVILVLSLAHHYWSPEYFKEDSRGTARLLEKVRLPGERLLVGTSLIPLQYYYKEPMEHWSRVRLVQQRPSNTPDGAGLRVWVAATRTWQNPNFQAFLKEMSRCYPVERRYVLAGYEVTAYDLGVAGWPVSCTLQKVEQSAVR